MSAFTPLSGFDPASLAGSTILLPSVSLGNLPQLAADLLVSTLALPRVGFVGDGRTVVPFVGRGERGAVVTGGLEVYGKDGLYVVQQRAPTLKSAKDAHAALVVDFARQARAGCVLVLTSLDAASQDDAQLLTPHQRLLPPSASPPSARPLAQLASLPPFDPYMSAPSPAPTTPASPAGAAAYPPFLPSAGLARRLLAALHAADVAHGALLAWCVEGDNRADAHALAAAALGVVGHSAERLVEPKSWAGLFGPAEGWSGGLGADAEIYG